MAERKISLIVPVYNEMKIIEESLNSFLKKLGPEYDIIVVDDNSPDGTWKKVEEISKKNKNVRLLNRKNKRGLASAIRDGLELAKGEVVAWMDLDMDVNVLARMVGYIGEYDVVIASRYVQGGKDKREFFRVLLSYCLNFFASLILDPTIRDYTTGYVVAKKQVCNKIKFRTEGYGEYCIEFLYLAKKNGFKIKEIPYECNSRKSGETKTIPGIKSLIRHMVVYFTTVFNLGLKYK